MGLAIGLMLLVAVMAVFGLAMIIGGIVFIVVGLKEKKKTGKKGLIIAGIIMAAVPVFYLLQFIGFALLERL